MINMPFEIGIDQYIAYITYHILLYADKHGIILELHKYGII